MKKLLFLFAIAWSINVVASPVDADRAGALAHRFVEANFSVSSRDLGVTLAHTEFADRNEAGYYVFNVGQAGFIIISGDDSYRPVIGYSENGSFDIDNVPPALQDYLDGIVVGRSMKRSSSSAAPDVAAEWQLLEKTGKLMSRHGGRGTDYLVKTQWDQSYPYNYHCPEDPNGSGGHAIVGCLATSMAQLVAFWKYPEHGNGSHCYYHEDYGQICADFENTYYDWDHIANKVTASSPIEEIEAASWISFHCGVSIDMGYGPDGSGGASGPIPNAMHTYFSYSDAIVQLRRDDFETAVWKSMVREQFDMGWPMYYGGCDDGCHAFICDGYDDYDMFHFNLGWGGSSDGWYLIDEAPYTNPADAMFNFVPQSVYDATPSAPTNLTVTPNSDTSFDAVISWTNPTTYLDGTTMTDIEKVVIMRNSMVCQEITEGIVAGQTMSVTDHVPYYDSYEYKVFVVSNERNGKQGILRNVAFGPSCEWRIAMTTTQQQGWDGGYVSVYNMANTEVEYLTMTSSTPQVQYFNVPLGRVGFGWTAPNDTIDNMTINIYNSQNDKVFTFSGSSSELTEGMLFDYNNGCGNSGTCDAPTNLEDSVDDDDVIIAWNGSLDDAYAFCIYRDGVLYRMVTDNQPFVDNNTGGIGHCYNVSVLCENGESDWSEMNCVTVGESCDPARNIWYDVLASGKPLITWDTPIHHENLTGYYVYRKCNDGDYQRIKSVSPNKNEYREIKSLEYDNWYYYKVVAYYRGIECYSVPAKARYCNEYFVKFYYSADGIEENPSKNIEIYPNPAKDFLTINAENMSNVRIFNSFGQKVFEQVVESSEVSINLNDYDSGIYLVKIVAAGNEITRKISVVK